MNRSLRVGIAGAGWVAGARHLPGIAGCDGVELVAVYDRDTDRAAALAADATANGSAKSVRSTDDLDALLDMELDAVHVTSSPWSHHDLAVAALQSGAHVFTEKPMAMNSIEANQMARAARDADRLLCVSHNFLYSDAMSRARRAIGDTPVNYVAGLQLSAHTRRLPTWYEGLPGGLMFDEMPHMLYTLDDLLGGGLALDHVRADLDADDQPRTVEVLVSGRTGSGQVTMIFTAAVSEWHVLATTAERTVGLDLFRDIAVSIGPDGAHGAFDIAKSSLGAIGGHVAGFARAGARLVTKRQYWGHDVLIAAFYDAVRNGGTSPIPLENALGIVALADDIVAQLPTS